MTKIYTLANAHKYQNTHTHTHTHNHTHVCIITHTHDHSHHQHTYEHDYTQYTRPNAYIDTYINVVLELSIHWIPAYSASPPIPRVSASWLIHCFETAIFT